MDGSAVPPNIPNGFAAGAANDVDPGVANAAIVLSGRPSDTLPLRVEPNGAAVVAGNEVANGLEVAGVEGVAATAVPGVGAKAAAGQMGPRPGRREAPYP